MIELGITGIDIISTFSAVIEGSDFQETHTPSLFIGDLFLDTNVQERDIPFQLFRGIFLPS